MWVHNRKYDLWFIPAYWWWGERVYIRTNAEWWGTAHNLKNMENEVIWHETLQYCRAHTHLLKGKKFQVIFIRGNIHLPVDRRLGVWFRLRAAFYHAVRCCSRAHCCFCSLVWKKTWSCPRGSLCQAHGNFQKTSEQLQGSLKTDCDVNVNPCDSSYAISSNYLRRRKIFLWLSLFAITLIEKPVALHRNTVLGLRCRVWRIISLVILAFPGVQHCALMISIDGSVLPFAFCLHLQSERIFFPLLNLMKDKVQKIATLFWCLIFRGPPWHASSLGKWCQPAGTCVIWGNGQLEWEAEILLGKSQGHFIWEKRCRYFYWWWCKASAWLFSLLGPGVALSFGQLPAVASSPPSQDSAIRTSSPLNQRDYCVLWICSCKAES